MKNKLKEQLQKIFPNEEIIIENDGCFSYGFTIGKNIVRVPKLDMKSYRKEKEILDFLKGKTSFETPDIEIVEDEELSYSIHKKIIEKTWSIDDYNTMSEKEKDLFSYDLAKFLSEIHSISIDDILKETTLLKLGITLSDEKIQDTLKNDFSEEEIEKIINWFRKKEAKRKDDTFIHQDFCGNNSIIKNNRLKGVFDFGNSCIGDKHLDFHSFYKPECMDLLKDIIKHYEGITGEKIDINKIKDLKEVGCIYVLECYANNPLIKMQRLESWNKLINKLREIIK